MIEVVWFKRDLRVRDHAPLFEASLRGPVLPLYVVEPSLRQVPDYDACHWTFVRQSLVELRERLAELGQPLVVRVGEVVDVLGELHRELGIQRLWAHEETGNGLTYARDLAVAKWARTQGIEFIEKPNGGVVRRLKTRDGWSKIWEQRMAAPIVPTPAHLRPVAIAQGGPGALPAGAPDHRILAQRGGEIAAHELLDSFLRSRGQRYNKELSSPVTAFDSCSRLSPHLAYGTISTRIVAQRARDVKPFMARLHWRDHFMQKLEDEPAIEFRNFVRGFDGLREDDFSAERFEAWKEGRTGYPMVDACMRCLRQTGWINFRMRAMLMSFASYHLWLHWRETGLHLARLFVDYEPGIHWSQTQMQSGTTGINTLRIYSPAKQLEDHDPKGLFIGRWIPELLTPEYPKPIVDHATAVREARRRITEFRRQNGMAEQIRQVTEKHGSRKRPAARRKPKAASGQGSLFG